MFIAHGSVGFSLVCDTKYVFSGDFSDLEVTMGINRSDYNFYYDCPFRDNTAHGPE